MVNPTSFHNVTKKWIPEIRAHNPSSPIVLVGTQSDLLLDVNVLINLDRSKVTPVLSSRAKSMADKIRATDYVECSSLTQKNLKEAFDAAIFAAIKNKARKSKKRRFSDRRTKALSRYSWKKFFCFVWIDCGPCGLKILLFIQIFDLSSLSWLLLWQLSTIPCHYLAWDAKWYTGNVHLRGLQLIMSQSEVLHSIIFKCLVVCVKQCTSCTF